MPKHSHARVYFTPEVAKEVLRRIAEGEPLLRICGPEREAGMPDRITVHQHLRTDRDFRCAYLAARQAQADTLADEMIDIADGKRPVAGQPASVGRDWLRVSARQWLAAVMSPASYGRSAALREEMEAIERRLQPSDDIAKAARIAAIFESARRQREKLEAAGAEARGQGGEGAAEG